MTDKSTYPDVHRIIADSDLDGMCAAVVLKKAYPEAEVHFVHAALIRSGIIDDLIDERTVTVDLPFHPKSGWYLDHHLTNKPSDTEHAEFTSKGGIVHWDHAPSAARLAFDMFREQFEFPHLEAIMPLVDALDSGGISLDTFLEDGPLLQLSRTLNYNDVEYMHHLLSLFQTCTSMDEIYADTIIQQRMVDAKISREEVMDLVAKRTTIVNRLAICRLEDTGHRSNGYLITAYSGRMQMHVASFMATVMEKLETNRVRHSQPVSMQIHSCQKGKIDTTYRDLRQNLIHMEVAMQTLADVESNHQVLNQIYRDGWRCGRSEHSLRM